MSEDKDFFNFIIRSIKNEPERIWQSTELLKIYQEKGGTETNTTRFIQRIEMQLHNEIYCFKSPGISTIIMHKEKAGKMFNLVQTKEEDDDTELERVASRLKSEIKEIPKLNDEYPVLDIDCLSESTLPTLKNVLQLISPKFSENSKVISLISSIIATISSSKTSMLQVALGLFINEKKLIQHLYEYGITSSYDEVLRFKVSAAYASRNQQHHLDSSNGLIQGITDNFDTNLCTPNGLKQTHSLATIIVQHQLLHIDHKRKAIPRLKKHAISKVPIESIPMQIYSGAKKPAMPKSF